MQIIVLLIAVYIISLFADLSFLMVSTDSPWWTCLTFNFVHVSLVHLLVNSFVFYQYSKVLNRKDALPIVLLSIIIVPFAALVSAQHTPTCGFSAVISVIIGYYLPRVSRKFFFKALGLILFSYVFTFLCAGNVNTLIHILSFFPSLALTFAWRKYDSK